MASTHGSVIATLALLGAVGCSSGQGTIELVFPNPEARAATKLLAVFAFSRDAVGVRAVDVRCADLNGRLARGEQIPGDPAETPFEAPFDGKMITSVPSGDPVLFVVGFNDTTEIRKPIVEGCTQDFDSGGNSDVPIELQVILPGDLTFVKVAGDRQVGSPGSAVATDLTVELMGALPGLRNERYPIPGVQLTFTPETGVTLPPAAQGVLQTVNTDPSGRAAVPATLPSQRGVFEVEVTNPSDEIPDVTFSLAAIDPVSFGAPSTVVTGGAVGRPVEVAVANVSGSDAVDVVLLGCNGDENACLRGQAATDPAGASRLVVVDDVANGADVQPVAGDFGITPGGMAAAAMVPGDHDDVAIVNSRRMAGGRVSEGSEILVFRGGTGGLALDGRYAITASNAVGLVPYRFDNSDTLFSVLTAGQGRRVNDRPCRLDPSCLNPTNDPACPDSPELCGGCAPEEKCVCPANMSCTGPGALGVCFADDRQLDQLANDHNRADRKHPNITFVNALGCTQPVLDCNKQTDVTSSDCNCMDNVGRESRFQNKCEGRDACFCRGPTKALIGVAGTTRFPRALAVGALRTPTQEDVVVATEGGLDFIRAEGRGEWVWKGQPLVNDQAHGVFISDFNRDGIQDVAWFSETACSAFSQRTDPCPIVGTVDSPDTGCVGVVLRQSAGELDRVTADGCRRYPVPFSPTSFCGGDFNGDGSMDIALAGPVSDSAAVFSGAPNGGISTRPDLIPLGPGRVGGPIGCGRVDADASDDIVVADGVTGDVVVLGTGP